MISIEILIEKLLENIGALKFEYIKRTVLELGELKVLLETVTISKSGIRYNYQPTGKSSLCYLIQKPDQSVVGIKPIFPDGEGTYPGKGYEIGFKARVGGWFPGKVIIASEEMSIPVNNGYQRQTVNVYKGLIDPAYLKSLKSAN